MSSEGDDDYDDAEFDRKMDYFSEIADENGFRSHWSIYKVKDMHDRHPFGNITQLEYGYASFDEVVVPVRGSTWLDLYRAADKAILRTYPEEYLDAGAILIESFIVNPAKSKRLTLHTGT
jgi:hypothetical protein